MQPSSEGHVGEEALKSDPYGDQLVEVKSSKKSN
jgi:hypothetical protein